MIPHQFRTRVYYEDTDLAGIVYYANYLKFIERARTEWVASLGVDQMALKAREGIVFAVRRVEADFLRPAKFGDDLLVETTLQSLGGARIGLEQVVTRGGDSHLALGGVGVAVILQHGALGERGGDRQGGADDFVLEQRGRHVREHDLAVGAGAVELAAGFLVAHGFDS